MGTFIALNREGASANYLSLSIRGSISANSVVADSFRGSFTGDGNGLVNVPVPPGFVTTSVYNPFTASYYNTSASFDTRIFNSSSSIRNVSESLNYYTLTSSFNGFTSSYNGVSASISSTLLNVINTTASFATTGSNIFRGNQIITGSVFISGSVIVSGSVSSFSFTGSLSGTASYAISTSYASTVEGLSNYVLTTSFNSFTTSYVIDSASFRAYDISLTNVTASFATTGSNIFRGNQIITGSVNITGSLSYWSNANSILANTGSTVGVVSPLTYYDSGILPYTGTLVWAGGSPPSGSENHFYFWTRLGNQITVTIALNYTITGSTNTSVTMQLPSTCPTPVEWIGTGTATTKLYTAYGYLDSNTTGNPPNARGILGINSDDTGYVLSLIAAALSARVANITCIYRC